MRLNRRDLLLQAFAATATIALPSSLRAESESRFSKIKPAITPELRLHNANTDEKISSVFFKDGNYVESEVNRLNWFMRDWRQAQPIDMDKDLFWGLAALREAAMRDGHEGEITFLSGYRSKKTNDMLRREGYGAAPNSLHLKGKASDFRINGIPIKPLSDYVKWLEIGGVGHYPGSFVHMDTGERRHWVG